MRQLIRYMFLLIITLLIITIFILLKPVEFIPVITVNKIEPNSIHNQSIDNFTRCLLDMGEALDILSIPWFLAHGTALMYWRSKNFISDDMDIGVFYKDLAASHFNETNFLMMMKEKFRFQLSQSYGQIDHGQEWTFLCPQSPINIDIFVFYSFNDINSSFTYWTASYNGLCNEMLYGKCRWAFSDFNLTTFDMYNQRYHIVPLEFIIERYGKDYMIPKKYDYFQSLTILPNLIPEYKNQSKNVTLQITSKKHSAESRRKGKRRRVFIKIFR